MRIETPDVVVRLSLLRRASAVHARRARPIDPMADLPSGTPHVVVGEGGAIVRAGVELGSALVARVPSGLRVEVVETARAPDGRARARIRRPIEGWLSAETVSYTHLTLPTILLV